MRDPGVPSLDQIRVFLAVVEAGSFAAAGRQLNRTTSAISYTIAGFENQLGTPLFDREQTRKPILTQAGRLVLSKARLISSDVDDLRASVKAMLGGLESEVSLAVDVMLPNERLIDAVRAFEAQFPSVKLRLHVEALQAIAQLVQSGVANLGVGGRLHTNVKGIEQIAIGQVELLPVAAPTHPLARRSPIPPGWSRRHRQLVLTVRSSFAEAPDAGVVGDEQWRLTDLAAKHALLAAGVGWGLMPEPVVRSDLENGQLVRLCVPEIAATAYPLQVIYRTDTPPGPAGAWLLERFAEQARPPPRRKRATRTGFIRKN